MKRFLLWICSAALTLSSTAAAPDAVLQKRSASTPYAGLPGLKAEVSTGDPHLDMLKKFKRQNRIELNELDAKKLHTPVKAIRTAEKARIMKAAEANGFVPEVYGSVIYSDDQNVETGAIYQIPTNQTDDFAYMFPEIDASYGGVLAGNTYYTHNYLDFWGLFTMFSVEAYNAETGEMTGYWSVSDASMLAADLAYNVTDGKVYGLFFDYDEETDKTAMALGRVDYPKEWNEESEEQPVLTILAPLSGTWNALAIDKNGTFYGVKVTYLGENVKNSQLCTIDPTTGKTTIIGNTGVQPQYTGSATFDLATNDLYYAASDVYEKGFICKINTTTGRATHLADFSNNEQVVGLYTRTLPVPEGSPNIASNLSASFAAGSKTGEVSFTMPTTLFSGEVVSGSLNYTISADGVDIITGSAQAGATVKETCTLDYNGEVRFGVVISNDKGSSPAVSTYGFVGYAVACEPENVKITEDSFGHITMSWDAVTTDINGATLPSVDYTVGQLNDYGYFVEPEIGYTSTIYSKQVVDPTVEQDVFQFGVMANGEGGSNGTVAPLLFVGAPYTSFHETFPDGDLSYNYLLRTLAGSPSWQTVDNSSLSSIGITDQNNDNGCLAYMANYLDESSSIITGKIDLTGMTEPVFTFWVYTIVGEEGNLQSDVVSVSIAEFGKDYTEVFSKPIAEIGNEEGWHQATIDLSAYKDKSIQISLNCLTQSFKFVFIDNLRVGSTLHKDLHLSELTGDTSAKPGENYNVTAVVRNNGIDKTPAAKVTLHTRGGSDVTKDVPELEPGENADVTFTLTMHPLTTEVIIHQAEVVMEGDEDSSNNLSPLAGINPIKSSLPIVKDLSGTAKDKTVTLTWNEPTITTANIEDFESAGSFAKTYGDWTFVDNDGGPVGGFNGIDIPGITIKSPATFFVFDNSGSAFNASFETHSGTKFLASLFNLDASKVDDWAISPELSGNAQTISFWARSYANDYLESLEVLYSTSDKSIASFKATDVADNAVPSDWTEYTVELPAGAKYFAVRCTSQDKFMLMLDDFTFISTKNAVPPSLIGFDIYRNGEKLNSDLLDEGYYEDVVPADGIYSYAVLTHYDQGVSSSSNVAEVTVGASGIEAATTGITIAATDKAIVVSGAEGKAITVSSIDGKTIFAGEGNAVTTVSVGQGIYIVKAADTVAKIIVR